MDIPFTSRRARRRFFHALGWVTSTAMLSAALLAPGSVSAATTFATISGYAPGTSANDQPGTWGDDCTRVDVDDTDDDDGSYVLAHDYRLVVARADDDGDEEGTSTTGHLNANTVFENPTAGQTVWADSNGSGDFDYVDDTRDKAGDDEIDHVILCGPTDTTSTPTATSTSSPAKTTPTPTASSSPSGGVHGVVGTPAVTPPETDVVPEPTSSGSEMGFRAVLLGLAVLVAAFLVIQPRKRRDRG
jgi:hypothetical protein